MGMFCYQCEQTAKGEGCTAHGVCGKGPEAAALQDLLVWAAKAISMYAARARELALSRMTWLRRRRNFMGSFSRISSGFPLRALMKSSTLMTASTKQSAAVMPYTHRPTVVRNGRR